MNVTIFNIIFYWWYSKSIYNKEILGIQHASLKETMADENEDDEDKKYSL